MAERYSKSVAKRTIGQLPRVQPVAERVDYSEAEMWKTVAQSAGQLSNQYYQYAQEDARHQAIINAEGYDFEKGPDGLTVMPPPTTEGGSIYQKTYNAIINDNYKRSIKTDVENRLSEIYSKEFYDPDTMKDSLNNSLSSTLEIVPEHMRNYVNGVGEAYVGEYYSRALKEKTRRIFNANVSALNEEKTTLIESRVGPNIDNLKADSIREDLVANITKRFQMQIITQKEAETELELLNQFGNFDNIKKIINSRSSAQDGALLNSADSIRALAQMFEGFEPVQGKTIDFYNTDGTVTSYNKETIDALIPDKDLKTAIANQLNKRASHIDQMNTVSQEEIDMLRLDSFYLNGGKGSNNLIPKKTQEKWANNLLNKELNAIGITLEEFQTSISSGDTSTSVAVITKLLGDDSKLREYEIFPDFLANTLKQVFRAEPSMIANFHQPFYRMLKQAENADLYDLYKEKVDNKTQGYFTAIKSVVGLGEDASQNEQVFVRIVERMNESYNEDIRIKMNDITKNLDNDLQTNSVITYMEKYIQKENLIPLYRLQPYVKAQILDESLEYLSGVNGGKKDLDIEDINKAIKTIVEKYEKTLSDDEDIIGFKTTEQELNTIRDNTMLAIDDGNSPVQWEDLVTLYDSDENKRIVNTRNNILNFGPKKAHNHSFLSTIIAGNLNNKSEKGEIILDSDYSNIYTPQELYADYATPEDALIETEVMAGEGIPNLTSDMYESFTWNYQGREIPMILGVTYRFAKTSDTRWDIVLINKDPNTGVIDILGTVNGKDNKPVGFDLTSILNRKKEEARVYSQYKFVEKRINDLPDQIVGKVPSSGFAGTGIKDKSKVNQRIIDKNKEINNEIKILNDKLLGIKGDIDLIEKERTTINEKGTTIEQDEYKNMFKISFVTQIPTGHKAGILSTNGSGVGTVVDASNYIANALPGADAESTARILIETAFIESDFGRNKETYDFENNKDMGIWQNERAMRHIISELGRRNQDSQLHANAKTLENAINKLMPDENFSFANMTVEHLRFPVISAAVARLYIANQDARAIPKDIKGRGQIWSKVYNTNKGTGGYLDYIAKIKKLEKEGHLQKLINDRMTSI